MREPVIILTCMRSYSSVVSGMLGQHPSLYALPEINPFLGDRLGQIVDLLSLVRPRSLDGLFRLVAELEFGGQTHATIEEARAWISQRRSWTPVEFLDHVSERIAPRRFVEKSPSSVVTVGGLDRMLAFYPNAFYLHLCRHPTGACRSIAKISRFGEPRPNRRRITKDPERSWFEANAAILDAAGRVSQGRFLTARGEDILTYPDNFLSQVCDWLDLETTPESLVAMRRPELSPFASIGPSNAPFGADPGFLNNPVYKARRINAQSLGSKLDWAEPGRTLAPETVALAHQLGYCDTEAVWERN